MKRLPDSELEIMQVLWELEEPIYRIDIENVLNQKHMIASTTLLTLLTRLSEKGFCEIIKNGRKHIYKPIISKSDYLASQSKNFIQQLCGGNLKIFANALCDSGLSKEDIEELKALLERNEL